MRILIFNWRDIANPRAGGAEIYTHEIAKRLVERGHDITWLTAGFEGGAREEAVDGIRILREGNRATVYAKARARYERDLRGHFDVVIDEINTRPFMTPAFVDEPVVALIHQLAREFWFKATVFPISLIGYLWLENHWLRRYGRIPTITVSDSTKSNLLQLGFRNVTVVLNGFNTPHTDEVPKKADAPTLVFVGRMVKTKRPHHAIRAFRIARQSVPDLQLWMVGDGPLLPRLRRRWGCEDGLCFCGRVSEEEKNRMMGEAHLILVPGIREGWGRIVTEANLMGTPAVGYCVPGLRDSIIDGRTGLLCKNKPSKMAMAVRELLTDRRYTLACAQRAMQTARKLTWERSVEAFEARLAEEAR